MICETCGNEYSLKVWRIHKDRCKRGGRVQKEKEEGRQEVSLDDISIVGNMSKAELIEMAEEFGIEIDRRWSKARIAEALES